MADRDDINRRREAAKSKIDASALELNTISQEIWSNPELGYKEHHAHKILTDFLEREGFEVTRNFHLETAFKATYGSNDGVNVCVMCEYDALAGIGHACGHNLIAECGVGAGLGIKAALELDERPIGKVTVLGTPAEEGAGGGKIRLMDAGALQGVDVAMMSHPYAFDVARCTALAMLPLTISYTGRAAHAAAAPWEGVNALDAAVMCYTSISVMRQQSHPDWRVHGVFTNGGAQPNVIPESAELSYMLRTPDQTQLGLLREKVVACAKGAALSTGCKVEITAGTGYADMVHNAALSSCHERHCAALGLVFPPERFGEKGGSLDMGNVSYTMPSIHPKFAIPTEALTHNPGFTKWAGKPEAQPPTLLQAKALALVGLEVMDPASGLLQRARKEFEDTVSKPVTSSS